MELLVVIAIISILAGLLLPAVEKAYESARAVQCASQLNQIGMGTLLYVDQHDDWFPPAFQGGTLPGQRYRDLVIAGSAPHYDAGYIPLSLLTCPSDKTTTAQEDYWPYYGQDRNWTSYSYNEPLGGRDVNQPSTYIPNHRIGNLLSPSKDFMNVEAESSASTGTLYYALWGIGRNYLTLTGTPRHNATNNYLFADGHVNAFGSSEYLGNYRNAGDTWKSANWGTVSLNYSQNP